MAAPATIGVLGSVVKESSGDEQVAKARLRADDPSRREISSPNGLEGAPTSGFTSARVLRGGNRSLTETGPALCVVS